MNSSELGISLKSLAELAMLISRIGPKKISDGREPSATSIGEYWLQIKSLHRQWCVRLDRWRFVEDRELNHLRAISMEVAVCDMVTRNWSTILLGLDQRGSKESLVRVGRNTVSRLMEVRLGLMSRLLRYSDEASSPVAEIERLRRRCDRWTDLLIGNLAGSRNLFEFAIDVERARDFATESHEFDPSCSPHPVVHLVTAGLRMSFLSELPDTLLFETSYTTLTQSILASLPEGEFHRDGTLRSAIERRVIASQSFDGDKGDAWFEEFLHSKPGRDNRSDQFSCNRDDFLSGDANDDGDSFGREGFRRWPR